MAPPSPPAGGGGFTLSKAPLFSDAELAASVAHLATEGYVLLKSRLPRGVALDIGQSMLAEHEAAHPAADNPASFQLIFGCFNGDARTWQYMPAHPDPLRVVQSLLGPSARAIEGISGRTLPGSGEGALHTDCAQDFQVLPTHDCAWGVNGIWMLSDFTEANGATRLVKRSHLADVNSVYNSEPSQGPIGQPSGGDGSPVTIPVTGEAGDVFLWHMGTLHQNGANSSAADVRVSFNCGYCPAWFNNRIMGGHQPITLATYNTMPPAVRAGLPQQVGVGRDNAFEYHSVPRPEVVLERYDAWLSRNALPKGGLLDASAMGKDEDEDEEAEAEEEEGSVAGSRSFPRPPPPLPASELEAAAEQLVRDGYCVLPARLPADAISALAGRCGRCHDKGAEDGDEGHEELLYGMMNRERAVWSLAASQPEVVALARQVVGPSVRAFDAASHRCGSGGGGELLEVGAHRSADRFEVVMPQPECPWLLEAVWPLTTCAAADGSISSHGGGEVLLVPGSHHSREAHPPSDSHPATVSVRLPAGSVLLAHGGLWINRHPGSTLPAVSSRGSAARGGSSGAAAAGSSSVLHVQYYAKWWNSWLEEGLEPLWPETYEAMPPAVQALMAGLRGTSRAELLESAFDETAGLERQRSEPGAARL